MPEVAPLIPFHFSLLTFHSDRRERLPVILTEDTSLRYAQSWRAWNPIEGFTPRMLTSWKNMYRRGYLRHLALLWDELLDNADPTIATVCPQRRESISALPFNIVTLNDSPEARLQQEAAQHLFDGLQVTDVVNQSLRGKVPSLIEDIMSAHEMKFAAHEMCWQQKGPDLTALLVRCPVSMLENTTGVLKYTGPNSALGIMPLEYGQWLVSCSRLQMASPLATLWWLKMNFAMGRWVNYMDGYSEPGLWATTTAQISPDEKSPFMMTTRALQAFGPGKRALFGDGVKINSLQLGDQGAAIFEPMIDKVEKWQITLAMRSDLGTRSAANAVGATLQGDSTMIRIMRDIAFVEETINQGLIRPFLDFRFGDGAQALVQFQLTPPSSKDIKQVIEKQVHARTMGVPQSIAKVAQELDMELPGDEEDLVTPLPVAQAAKDESAVELRSASNRDLDQGTDDDAMSADIQAALVADLEPVRVKLASLLQGDGEELPADLIPSLAKAVMTNGNLTEALLGSMAEGFFTKLGMDADAVTALLNDAITAVADESK